MARDPHAMAGVEHARRSGRSWWSIRYCDGHVLNEWDADPGSPNGHMDWPRLATQGRLNQTNALRLFAPNGKMAELGGDGDQSGNLFQFKVAARYFNTATGLEMGTGQGVLAHVIGIVTGYGGDCILYAWEPLPQPEPPPNCPKVPNKPDYFNREQPLWAIKEQHDLWNEAQTAYEAYLASPEFVDWRRQVKAWNDMGRGRLVGPMNDNVFGLQYQHVGMLHGPHLGLSTNGQT